MNGKAVSEAALQRCSLEKVFWKYAANLQENARAHAVCRKLWIIDCRTNDCRKLWIKKSDPSKNSRPSQETFDSTSSNSPLVTRFESDREYLASKHSWEEKIQYKFFQSFSKRIRQTLLTFFVDIIDATIPLMPNRLDTTIKLKWKLTNHSFVCKRLINFDYIIFVWLG